MGRECGPGVRPKRSRIIELYTDPPPGSTVVCVDELGPVTPRSFPPAPGWSPDGHRIKAPLEYSRGPDKAWVFGALRVKDGKSITFTSRSRNSKGYIKLLEKIERAIPRGLIYLIADNLSTHKSALLREWLTEHPRIEHAFIPKGAAWLNMIEVWWRLFIPAAGASRDRFRRQLLDRLCDEGRYSPVESESEAVGVGTTSKAAEASEAHFCVPSLRNEALRRRSLGCSNEPLPRDPSGSVIDCTPRVEIHHQLRPREAATPLIQMPPASVRLPAIHDS